MNRRIDHIDPAFDPRIADWLETDPDRAPGEVIDTILAALPSIPQRRTMLGLSWRFPPMPSTARLALTAVAIAMAAFVGWTLLPGPVTGPGTSLSPTARPSPVTGPPFAFTEPFASTIHGFSIRYPAGWQTRRATEPWTGGALNLDSPAADVIFDPELGDRLYMVVASQPYGGLTHDAWRDEQTAWLCTGDGAAMGWPTVDDTEAFAIICGSTASAVLIFTDTRGYLIRLVASSDEPGLAESYGWPWHNEMLETLDLRPEEALDPPSR